MPRERQLPVGDGQTLALPDSNELRVQEESEPKDDKALKEKLRLDRMGVKNDDEHVRGINVRPNAPHVVDVLVKVREEPASSYTATEMKIGEDEDGRPITMPALDLPTAKVPAPAGQPGTPAAQPGQVVPQQSLAPPITEVVVLDK